MSKDKIDSSKSNTSLDEASSKSTSSSSQDISGQSLERFTDQEWEKGASAKPAELLKMSKTPNTVDVFVGPKETIEKTVTDTMKSGSKESHPKERSDKGESVVQLVNRVANMLTTDNDDIQTEVSVTVTIRPDRRKSTKVVIK
ncbi:hypothetical protein DICVIV_03099 [Dictyocaulus viviparus]|uniref:Uncharacterized protein n=1 Tax=Dictyocaulus viviparus TaxID=29172 RepID=A0A0D8Y3L4_DICVI|nr:hypothetical protein DICVIV_03099 [Dictyocaulus viviparus]